jgi:hypothetical protein
MNNWRTGYPSLPGWYPEVNVFRDTKTWRFFNGEFWSNPVLEDEPVTAINTIRLTPLFAPMGVRWLPQPAWYAKWLRERGLPVGDTE